MKSDEIIKAARVAHGRLWRATSDESTGDKQARAVTLAWQNSVASMDIKCEVPVEEKLNERIDVVDFSTATAYELKASGKNPHHEFYKDIFKVIVYNQNHDKKLKHLVFLTEEDGADRLNKGLGKAVTNSHDQLRININIIGI